jgi:hypothetical protein
MPFETGGRKNDSASDESLQGWEPVVDDGLSLAQIIDRAFDYRGDVTILKADGTQVVGYLFNRNRDVLDPFVQLFGQGGAGRYTIAYAEIERIKFSGKDTAPGRGPGPA